MALRVEKSAWRLRIYKDYGTEAHREIKKLKKTATFNIKQLAEPNLIECMAHLSPRTRQQYLTYCCNEMEARGILKRRGRGFYFPVKKKDRDKEVHK
jgi:hypothetical protein